MLFEDAIALAACVVADHPELELIAIGRFVMVEELTAGTPWRISVHVRGQDRPRMLSCEKDLDDLKPKQIKPVAEPAMEGVSSKPGLKTRLGPVSHW